MNLTHPAVVGTVLCAGAFAVGTQIHGPDDALAKARQPANKTVLTHHYKMTPAGRCEQTLIKNNWHAGDLCDTLSGAPGFGKNYPASRWAYDNQMNGWKLVSFDDTGNGCWDTSSTTDVSYTLCWDGKITRP